MDRNTKKVVNTLDKKEYMDDQYKLQMESWLEFTWKNKENPIYRNYTHGSGTVLNVGRVYRAWKDECGFEGNTESAESRTLFQTNRCFVTLYEAKFELSVFLDAMEDRVYEAEQARLKWEATLSNDELALVLSRRVIAASNKAAKDTTCIVCSTEIAVTGERGRRSKVCSDECRKLRAKKKNYEQRMKQQKRRRVFILTVDNLAYIKLQGQRKNTIVNEALNLYRLSQEADDEDS